MGPHPSSSSFWEPMQEQAEVAAAPRENGIDAVAERPLR